MKTLLLITMATLFTSCTNRYSSSSEKVLSIEPSIKYSQTPGNSFYDPIIVYGASSTAEAIAAEYHYISTLHGKRGLDWFLLCQTAIAEKNKIVDVLEYSLNDSDDRRILYFDTYSFPKK